jgi:hypothetical protein
MVGLHEIGAVLLVNYTTLVASTKDYLETDETTFNSYIDQAIKLTEEDIGRKVQLPMFRKNATSSMTSSSAYLATPSDFLAPYELSIVQSGSHTFLIKKDVSFMREAFPSSTTTGTPKYYAMFDHNTLIVAPTPSSGFSVELHYYYKPTSIVSSSTSWLGDNAENAMLWGTVLHMYVFLKGNAELTGVYKSAYDEAINNLMTLGEGLKKKDSFRHGERRIPA